MVGAICKGKICSIDDNGILISDTNIYANTLGINLKKIDLKIGDTVIYVSFKDGTSYILEVI